MGTNDGQGLPSDRPDQGLPFRPSQNEEGNTNLPDRGAIPEPGPALMNDNEWTEKPMIEKWETLAEAAKEKEKILDADKFQKAYEAAVEVCIFDDQNGEESTLLHYLIRTIEPHRFPTIQLYKKLVEMSLYILARRFGRTGLFDSMHRAIERNHFDLLQFICGKAEDPKLRELVADGILALKSGQNCLHAVIAADPRNIEVVHSLVKCSGKEAFETQRSPNKNTPLHDFVRFGKNRFKICECKCRQCVSAFPAWVSDEHLYTTEFVKTLQRMVKEHPKALYTTNLEGKTPYAVHKETRRKVVNDPSWNELEYELTEVSGKSAVDIAHEQRQNLATTHDRTEDTPVENASLAKPKAIEGIQRSKTLDHSRVVDHKKNLPEKGSPADIGKPRSSSQRTHINDSAWSYSRHLAQEVAKQMLEACCSLSSWENAKRSIFGDQGLDDQTTVQTSLKMEDALYKDIEKDHDFLKLNSILAYVELHLAAPSPDSSLDADPFADVGLSMGERINTPPRKTAPEEARRKNMEYLLDVFKWLKHKGVKRILKLVIVDNQEWQCDDETIEVFLAPWDVRYLDWNKQDLSINAITQGASKLVELWLTWSGQNTALLGWSDPFYGLKKQLPQLRRVHVEIGSSTESTSKMTINLATFKKRIGNQSGEAIVVRQQDHDQAVLAKARSDAIEFDLPSDVRTGHTGSKKGRRGDHWEQENENNHRWMGAIRNFQQQVAQSYNILKKDSPIRVRLDSSPIKVALIDDGVTPGKLRAKGCVEGGWPLDGVAGHRTVSTYYNSTEGHGTTMANLIQYVCPFVHLYVAKLEKDPPRPYRSVVQMAAEAVKWAVSQNVDVISMSWTIKENQQNHKDIQNLTGQIQIAGNAGIALFCSSDDTGAHVGQDQLLPSPSTLLKRIGSCNGNGTKSDFVSEANIHYLFPGEKLPVMQQHLKGTGNLNNSAKDKGSSASTALAAGLAALILWCTVISGGDKREFANQRMYALFDKLKADETRNGPSLVDVSGLIDQIRAQGGTASETIKEFVKRLRGKIPDQMRVYNENTRPSEGAY